MLNRRKRSILKKMNIFENVATIIFLWYYRTYSLPQLYHKLVQKFGPSALIFVLVFLKVVLPPMIGKNDIEVLHGFTLFFWNKIR